MGVFVNNVRDIGQCRVIIIITIIIITLFTVMKSGAPLLGLAKYTYIMSRSGNPPSEKKPLLTLFQIKFR